MRTISRLTNHAEATINFTDPLTEVLRNGVRALLAQAVEADEAPARVRRVRVAPGPSRKPSVDAVKKDRDVADAIRLRPQP